MPVPVFLSAVLRMLFCFPLQKGLPFCAVPSIRKQSRKILSEKRRLLRDLALSYAKYAGVAQTQKPPPGF